MRIYSAAIGNFIAQHMCTGGIYLCGGLTKSILPKISGVDILHEWKQRQIELAGTL